MVSVAGGRVHVSPFTPCLSSQETVPQAPPTDTMALISLEDLEGLNDDQLDDDITDNPEPMDGDDQLLSHWQAVASTHQVSVPPGEWVEPLARLQSCLLAFMDYWLLIGNFSSIGQVNLSSVMSRVCV